MRFRCSTFVYLAFVATTAHAGVIYNDIPSPLPPGTVSLAPGDFGIQETGNLIQLSTTGSRLGTGTVILSDYAFESRFEPIGLSTGYFDTARLDIFNVNNEGTVGARITSATTTFLAPWQPQPGTCPDPLSYRASDGACYQGKAFAVNFNFTGTTLPNQVVAGITFNTSTVGPAPFGKPGPYDLLNVGFPVASPTVGANPTPAITYLDFGTGFGPQDVGLTGNALELQLATIPEPGTFLLFAAGIFTVASLARTKGKS